ncbi:MAG: adenosylcobinamide-phosphate synthase CbiB [Clostridiales bacterium]
MPIFISTFLDFILGDPKGFPHPIILVGKLIGFYEKLFYRGKNKKLMGFFFMLAVLGTVGGVLALILWLASKWMPLYWIISIYLLYTSLAWRSLKKETGYVFQALKRGNIVKARKMLSYVVGRDTDELNEEEIIKATLETIGENTIDGVLAPLFYMIIGYFIGIPVIFVYLYKSINTLDSMVGYKNDKYEDFGYFSAKLDDVVNWIPARIGSFIMLLGGLILGYDFKNGCKIWKRDRFAHNSPNSAQSESVVAGLLGVQLGGAHCYFGKEIFKPTIGDALREPNQDDYTKCCRILDAGVIITLLIYTGFYLIKIL